MPPTPDSRHLDLNNHCLAHKGCKSSRDRSVRWLIGIQRIINFDQVEYVIDSEYVDLGAGL